MGTLKADQFPWTEPRIALLKKLWGEGKTASQIAGTLGKPATRSSVVGKAHRLKLAGRPSPIKAGAVRTGNQTGVRNQRAYASKDKGGRPEDKEFWTDERVKMLIAAYTKETVMPISRLARKLNCGRERIYAKAHRMGLDHPKRGRGPEKYPAKILGDYFDGKEPPQILGSHNIPLREVRSRCCVFPTTPHSAKDHKFCGLPIWVSDDLEASPSPYCPAHRDIARKPIQIANDDRPIRSAAE